MRLFEKIKKLSITIVTLSIVTLTMSGCVYYNNKNWDDLTYEERKEARQEFEEVRKELEEELSGDSMEDKFVQSILNAVEQYMR